MPKRRTFDEVLRYSPSVHRSTIKRYYYRWREEQGLPMRCDFQDCEFHTSPLVWKGRPLPLILDHIDGVNGNNVAGNLRLLCPNCNQQLPTHGGGNKGRVVQEEGGYGQREAEKWHYTLPADTGRYWNDVSDSALHHEKPGDTGNL